jgi:hypothetical protein
MFLMANNSLPPDLSVLPKREGFANQTTDGWGRPLIYSTNTDETVSLTSLGRDGVPGGMGDDADIVRRFRISNENGTPEVSEIHDELEDKR